MLMNYAHTIIGSLLKGFMHQNYTWYNLGVVAGCVLCSREVEQIDSGSSAMWSQLNDTAVAHCSNLDDLSYFMQ